MGAAPRDIHLSWEYATKQTDTARERTGLSRTHSRKRLTKELFRAGLQMGAYGQSKGELAAWIMQQGGRSKSLILPPN